VRELFRIGQNVDRVDAHAGHHPSPAFGPLEDGIPKHNCTVNNNTNKSRSFNALGQHPVQFQRILPKCV
jgi:hypothetical protein